MRSPVVTFFYFFNDTATTEIYTLSLHDALPILGPLGLHLADVVVGLAQNGRVVSAGQAAVAVEHQQQRVDRKSTRLNSSHANISYAVFCLKKKNTVPLTPMVITLRVVHRR